MPETIDDIEIDRICAEFYAACVEADAIHAEEMADRLAREERDE